MSKVNEVLKEKGIDFEEEVVEKLMDGGALDPETKRLMTIACATAVDCKECVNHHTKLAKKEGIEEEKIEEAMLVASLVGFGSRSKHLAQYKNKN
ncbi:MAG: Damma-carboxymuconolactone decarboxylase-like protein [Candidatus Methanohalarchaeum thermophilum]|uniref:Damma-carboxymuconolactone decarboxylase-like protein n=1 Tax=Methanohalarchaeum thermophilum TaxID=1903181 RepID=A0A1Q6DSF5_METT1|nr:MAG: Damma-carboxymuconolactone decarboxylase-like protein [Candidatus Methanohalarchaeum thermophilum]